MTSITFIVRDATGKVIRTGSCQPADLEKQAQAGEVVARPCADDLEEVAEARARLAAELEALRAAHAPEDPIAVLQEALKAKGIVVTDIDLQAAAAALQARRTPPAEGGN